VRRETAFRQAQRYGCLGVSLPFHCPMARPASSTLRAGMARECRSVPSRQFSNAANPTQMCSKKRYRPSSSRCGASPECAMLCRMSQRQCNAKK